jgi:hypothetical protein
VPEISIHIDRHRDLMLVKADRSDIIDLAGGVFISPPLVAVTALLIWA